ncbi:MAG: prolyl oligopeptidase family serine peptidase [Polyangiales bacterium]
MGIARYVLCLFLMCCAETLPPSAAAPSAAAREPKPVSWPEHIAYPSTRRVDASDTFHAQTVADPYRWLEDLESPEVRTWVLAQNELAESTVAQLAERDALRRRIAELMRFESFGVPLRRRGQYFWRYSDGRQDQPVVATANGLSAAPTTLVDFNQLSPDGQFVSAGFVPSDDGARVVYGLSAGGGDWQTWHVRDVASSRDRPDELNGIKYYRPVFAPDGKSLYYSRFPTPAPGQELLALDRHCKVYLHRLGSPSSADQVVYERPDQPTWQFRPLVTRDGRYLVITIGEGEVGDRGKEQLVYFDLQSAPNKPVALIDHFDAEYVFIGNDGPVFFVLTTLDADNKRIVAIDTRDPERTHWRDVVPVGAHAIDEATLVGRQLLVTTLRDAHSVLSAYELDGRFVREAELPGLGTVVGLNGGPDDTETFFAYTSYTEPRTVYRYELASGKVQRWKQLDVAFDASQLETQSVFFSSADGQRVPMFITAKRGLARDGARPTLLSGYGGGGVSTTPWFDPSIVAWLERGGVFAVVNVRGGGEYGEAWHLAAARAKKHVSADDLRAAGHWLIDQKYTNPRQLGATGTSAGGFMVSAAAMQEPGLFGAVVPISGLYDLVRSRLFGEGVGWDAEYGTVDDPAEFRAMLAISPLHTVRPSTAYPALMIVGSDHDVRVAPLHAYKYAAALQAAQSAPAPVLLRVLARTGHGLGTTLSQRIDQSTEVLAFMAHALQLPTAPERLPAP